VLHGAVKVVQIQATADTGQAIVVFRENKILVKAPVKGSGKF